MMPDLGNIDSWQQMDDILHAAFLVLSFVFFFYVGLLPFTREIKKLFKKSEADSDQHRSVPTSQLHEDFYDITSDGRYNYVKSLKDLCYGMLYPLYKIDTNDDDLSYMDEILAYCASARALRAKLMFSHPLFSSTNHSEYLETGYNMDIDVEFSDSSSTLTSDMTLMIIQRSLVKLSKDLCATFIRALWKIENSIGTELNNNSERILEFLALFHQIERRFNFLKEHLSEDRITSVTLTVPNDQLESTSDFELELNPANTSIGYQEFLRNIHPGQSI